MTQASLFPFDPQSGSWKGIQAHPYKFHIGPARGMGWHGIQRFRLGGPPDVPCGFELRYFELLPGAFSSLEKHAHIHLLFVLRGEGKALAGTRVWELRPWDLFYVPPWTPHRWINEKDEPFGFLCPVDADRDPPQPVSEEEWKLLEENPETARYLF
ncbi:cupin domain-containing protein [Candidatus Methylacidithermus pantelleriae]|uniref:Cupin type-2 domain-containing protein n=1 Tax=Candidatus Methylacidithermus pantelleriae TaxID=2744239 RepID=A0A8J2FX37_9BACT|nr:cupin domain-containing protein [Candidatus Methylacidithermus pantelleriae]CAF0702692.1 conserved hypothetical protein [Candidatus Methylacidithermus pantelleriae]